MVLFEEVWSIEEGGEMIFIGDASAVAITLSQLWSCLSRLNLTSPKEGGGRGPEVMYCLSVKYCQ